MYHLNRRLFASYALSELLSEREIFYYTRPEISVEILE